MTQAKVRNVRGITLKTDDFEFITDQKQQWEASHGVKVSMPQFLMLAVTKLGNA